MFRALEIVGEAAKRVTPAVHERYSDIPWREMAGMRDKLVHDYLGVNLERVWLTVQQNLPPLEPQLTRALRELEAEEG